MSGLGTPALQSSTSGGTSASNITQVGGSSITLGQKTMANSFPVVIASDQSAVPISGSVTANAGTNLNTSLLALEAGGNLAILAGGVASNRYKVNLSSVLGTNTAVSNGVVDAGTLRVTIASDSTGQITLASGSNTIGALTANQSVNDAQISGTATSVNVGTVDAGTQRVTTAIIGSVLVGQSKVSVTGTAVQLGSNVLTNGFIITAKSTNTAPISVGGSGVNNTVTGSGNGYILEAGASVSFAATNTNLYYINGTANDIVSFAGS